MWTVETAPNGIYHEYMQKTFVTIPTMKTKINKEFIVTIVTL